MDVFPSSVVDNGILFPPYRLPKVSSTVTLEGKGQLKFTVGKWSPHHNCSQLATANDTAIRG